MHADADCGFLMPMIQWTDMQRLVYEFRKCRDEYPNDIVVGSRSIRWEPLHVIPMTKRSPAIEPTVSITPWKFRRMSVEEYNATRAFKDLPDGE